MPANSRNLGLIFVQADLLRAADAADALPLCGVPGLLHCQGRNSIALRLLSASIEVTYALTKNQGGCILPDFCLYTQPGHQAKKERQIQKSHNLHHFISVYTVYKFTSSVKLWSL